MNTVTKLAAFSAVVAATFGGAMAVGAAVGPIDTGGNASHTMQMSTATGADERPRGLAVADAGFRLVAETNAIEAATATAFAFQILDDEGSPLTEFDELHERRLHLIVLSRNLIDYLHLPPTMDAAGRWTVDLPALKAGSYRIFADFQPAGGDNLTLGTDLVVPGTVDAP